MSICLPRLCSIARPLVVRLTQRTIQDDVHASGRGVVVGFIAAVDIAEGSLQLEVVVARAHARTLHVQLRHPARDTSLRAQTKFCIHHISVAMRTGVRQGETDVEVLTK